MIKIDFRTELRNVKSSCGWIEPADNWTITHLPTLKDLGIKVANDLPKQMKYSKFYDIVTAKNHKSFKRQLQCMLYTGNVNSNTLIMTTARCIMLNKDLCQETFNMGVSYFMYPKDDFDKLFDAWYAEAPQIIDTDDENDKEYDKDYWNEMINETINKIVTSEFKDDVRKYLNNKIDDMLILPETYEVLTRFINGNYKDKIQVIVGAAGSGKSYTSRKIIEDLRSDGKAQTVFVVSIAGCRAEQFVEDCYDKEICNVYNYSYAKFTNCPPMLRPNDLVIFEEVSQFDQTHLKTILDCADKCDVVVNGDYLQCASFIATGPLIGLFGGFCPISPGGEVHKCKNIKLLTEPYRPVSVSGKDFFRKSRDFWDKNVIFNYNNYKKLFDNKTFAYTWDGYEADMDSNIKKLVKETLCADYGSNDNELLNFLIFAVRSYNENKGLFKIVNGVELIGFCGIFNSKKLVERAQILLYILFKRLYDIDINKFIMTKTTFKLKIKRKDETINLSIYSGKRVEYVNKIKDGIILRHGDITFIVSEETFRRYFSTIFVTNTYKSQGNEYINVYALHKSTDGKNMSANTNYVQDTRAKEKYVSDCCDTLVKRTLSIYKQF